MMLLQQRQKLLDILKRTSFSQRETPIFHLASGADSRYYVDCKQALSLPEARALVAELIFDRIKGDSIDAVGGLELGAYPIATSVSDRIFQKTGKSVRAFVVRKEAKKHGVRNLIAGCVKEGDKALIVDDVITSGSSAIMAIRSARDAKLTVNRVIALVDRGESDGRKQIEAQGVSFEALFTLAELIEHDGDGDQSANSGANSKRLIRGQSPRAAAAG